MERAAEALERVRAICLALPIATERLSHGSPTFFVNDKPGPSGPPTKSAGAASIGDVTAGAVKQIRSRMFLMFLDDHHGDGRLAIWCAAPPGVQGELVEQEPNRFFVPPYVGHRGWIGVRLDVGVDWQEVDEIARDAYRLVAPKRLVAELDAMEDR